MKSTAKIIEEMEKEYNRKVSSAKMDIYPSIRTLLESFGEEIIKKEYVKDGNPELYLDRMLLKVKEIINSISK